MQWFGCDRTAKGLLLSAQFIGRDGEYFVC
jgi:hypothetical protein